MHASENCAGEHDGDVTVSGISDAGAARTIAFAADSVRSWPTPGWNAVTTASAAFGSWTIVTSWPRIRFATFAPEHR